MNREELEEKPYIDAFDYIEYLGEKIEDRKLIKINRFLQEDRKKKNKEIERLNNIINELEKWLEERLEKLDINGYDDDVFNGIELALQRLKELKGKE